MVGVLPLAFCFGALYFLYRVVSDNDRTTPISTSANLKALRGKPSTGRAATSTASGLVLTGKSLVVARTLSKREDGRKMKKLPQDMKRVHSERVGRI
jgi:hypothetical protein